MRSVIHLTPDEGLGLGVGVGVIASSRERGPRHSSQPKELDQEIFMIINRLTRIYWQTDRLILEKEGADRNRLLTRSGGRFPHSRG